MDRFRFAVVVPNLSTSVPDFGRHASRRPAVDVDLTRLLIVAWAVLAAACPAAGPTSPDEDTSATEVEGEGLAEGESEDNDGGSGEDGGVAEGEGEDGGSGEGGGEPEGGACARPPPCGAIPPSSSVVFSGNGTAEPSVTVDGVHVLTVAQSTRADVEAALGPGLSDSSNAYRIVHCAAGLTVQYVDGDDAFDDGDGAPSDLVARVLTLQNAQATMMGGYTLRSSAPAPSVDETSYPVSDGTLRFAATRGLEAVISNDGVVSGLVIYRRQDADRWTLPLDLAEENSAVGTLRISRPSSSTFADATALLGSAWDAQGVAEVNNIRVLVRVYASLGLRLAGVCQFSLISQSWDCDDPSIRVQSVTISAPFLGRDGALGVGATQADFVADLGNNSSVDDNGVTVFGGDGGLGVVFVEDATCTQRAAAIVLGYAPP